MNIVSLTGPLQDRIQFTDAEVAIVKKALKTKLFKKDEEFTARVAKFQVMLNELAAEFGITAPTLTPHPMMVAIGMPGFQVGTDAQGAHHIVIGRLSLTSILDGFYCVLHSNTDPTPPEEESVLAFGLSMFKQAAPNMFELARTSGRLMGTDVKYTDGGRIPQESVEESGGCDCSDCNPGPTDEPEDPRAQGNEGAED